MYFWFNSDQFGGHADVNAALSGLLEKTSDSRLGFSMVLDEAGNFKVGFNSRTINSSNPNFEGRKVPLESQQVILDADAIMKSTGREAYAK